MTTATKPEANKPRTVRKCDYWIEELRRFNTENGAVVNVLDAWCPIDAHGKAKDSADAEKWLRANGDKVEGKTIRIVKVCKQFTVKTETTKKVVLDES